MQKYNIEDSQIHRSLSNAGVGADLQHHGQGLREVGESEEGFFAVKRLRELYLTVLEEKRNLEMQKRNEAVLEKLFL